MRASFLLGWRLHRWEISAVAMAAALLSLVLLRVTIDLDALAATCRAATVVVGPCGSPTEFGVVYHAPSKIPMSLALQATAVLPFAAGVFLGAPLLARELEHGTTSVGWTLAGSRARWLRVRFLPVVVMGGVLLVVPAMAGEVLERALHPVIDPAASFEAYGSRGVLLVLRFLPVVVVAAALVGA
jgi:hypothetical protein